MGKNNNEPKSEGVASMTSFVDFLSMVAELTLLVHTIQEKLFVFIFGSKVEGLDKYWCH